MDLNVTISIEMECSESLAPSSAPTATPSDVPTLEPTSDPTNNPTMEPTVHPTTDPSINPTMDPTTYPTTDPSVHPTTQPTTAIPSQMPTSSPLSSHCELIHINVMEVSPDNTLLSGYKAEFDYLPEQHSFHLLSSPKDNRNQWIREDGDRLYYDDDGIEWVLLGRDHILTYASLDEMPPLDDPTIEWDSADSTQSIRVLLECKDLTTDPTIDPTADPTIDPTLHPTAIPTNDPTPDPTADPTINPTADPTDDPTIDPTNHPTNNPTVEPTNHPTNNPSAYPTIDPSADPTAYPTFNPSSDPTNVPTANPTQMVNEDGEILTIVAFEISGDAATVTWVEDNAAYLIDLFIASSNISSELIDVSIGKVTRFNSDIDFPYRRRMV